MEEEYSLSIPANIKTKKDLIGDISKADLIKAAWLFAAGAVPIGLSYFITRVDVVTVVLLVAWAAISFYGYSKCMYERKRSPIRQIKIMLYWLRSQKRYRYRYKNEWRN